MNEWMNKNEMGRQFIKSRQWIVYQLKKEGSGKYLHIERAHLHVEADRMMNGLPSTTDVNGQCPNRRGRRRTNQRRAPGHVTRHKQAYGPHQRRHYSPIKSGLIGNRLHQSILQQIFSKKKSGFMSMTHFNDNSIAVNCSNNSNNLNQSIIDNWMWPSNPRWPSIGGLREIASGGGGGKFACRFYPGHLQAKSATTATINR